MTPDQDEFARIWLEDYSEKEWDSLPPYEIDATAGLEPALMGYYGHSTTLQMGDHLSAYM